MNRSLRRLGGAGFRTVRTLLEGVTVLAVALYVEARIRTTRLPRLAAGLGVHLAEPEAAAVTPAGPLPPWARRRFLLVKRLMRRWPIATGRQCLRESLVLGFMLRELHPRLHLGVRRDGTGIAAHAWVECGGHDLDPRSTSYTSLTRPASPA